MRHVVFYAMLVGAVSVVGGVSAAHAGIWDVRELARNNNCPPTSITPTQQTLGSLGQTTYRVACSLVKTQGSEAPTAEALLIQCSSSGLCTLVRPLPAKEEKGE